MTRAERRVYANRRNWGGGGLGSYRLLAIGCWLAGQTIAFSVAAEPADVLKQHVIEQAKGGKLVLPVKSGPGKATPATILAADGNRLLVSAQGAELNLTWKMLGDEGLYELCQPLVEKAPAPVHAAYLLLAAKLGRADGPGFEKLLAGLWEKDADAAKSVEAAVKTPKKENAPSKTATDTKEEGAAGASPAAPDSLAATVGGVIGRDGKVNREAYVREALSYDLQSVHRMLGPDYEFFHKGGKAEEFPTLPAATDRSSGKIGRNGQGFTYQFGTPVADPGGYWTTQGQVLYVPDKAGDHGVDRIDVASYGHHCLQLKPEPAWWGGAHPEPGVLQKNWTQAAAGPIAKPFAIERSYCSFSENGYMLFTSGLIGAGSVNNVPVYPCFMFPRHKVPTAIALTSKNEFLLVTIWDTQEIKGQVAVLALGGTDKGRTAFALPSWGINEHIKLLGYIDLPGLSAPSDISATSFAGWGSPVRSTEYLIEDPKDREKRFKGDEISRTGCAVVVSRAESKAVFIDLLPLLQGVREMCFTSQANADKAKNAGLDPKQWPFSFETEPRLKPLVLSVVDVPHPTAVRLSPWNVHDKHPVMAVLACLDGRLAAYDVTGFTSEKPHTPQDVKPLCVAQVGRNPTCIAYQRYADPFRKATQGSDVGGWFAINFTFLVCCRGDREIDWIEITPKGAEVYRRLRDSRIGDPVHCQQTRTNSPDGAYIVTVADFKGRKLLNYRLGSAHIDGKEIPIPDGKSEFEFTGAMEFPGYVFRVNTDNVP